jgi:hypothetical protein
MRKPLAILLLASVITMVAVSVSPGESATASNAPASVYRLGYTPLPAALLTGGNIRFTRRDKKQSKLVRITAREAAHIAMVESRNGPRPGVVLDSLGGHVDTTQIVHDWVGTISWIPKTVPAYVVRIAGERTAAPWPDTHLNHYWNVVVDAWSGKIIVEFTYD